MAAYCYEAELYNVIAIINQIVSMHILKALGHDISSNCGIKINSVTRYAFAAIVPFITGNYRSANYNYV